MTERYPIGSIPKSLYACRGLSVIQSIWQIRVDWKTV